MGCDIHCYAEVKKDGSWVKVRDIFDHPYYRPEEETKIADGYVWNSPKTDRPYIYRNYDLFAILANVRNGRGFAGVPTGSGFVPIAMPRGLPNDVSAEVRAESDNWGRDGHSHSWLLLSELLACDWDRQITTKLGVVTKEGYKTFLENGKPEYYCGGVMGSSVVHVTEDEILDTPDDDGKSYYTTVKWQETYREAAGSYFFEKTIPDLQALGNPEDVRIVFWFDN